jgi:hypothetical protein
VNICIKQSDAVTLSRECHRQIRRNSRFSYAAFAAVNGDDMLRINGFWLLAVSCWLLAQSSLLTAVFVNR